MGGKKWLAVDSGTFHACGIDINNDAYCWGRQQYGSLNGSS